MTETKYKNSVTKCMADGTKKTYYYERSYSLRKPRTVLTEEKIAEIKLWYSRKVPKQALAEQFNITIFQLNKIIREIPNNDLSTTSENTE